MTSLRQLLQAEMSRHNIRIVSFCMETGISTSVLRKLLRGRPVRRSNKERAMEWVRKYYHGNVAYHDIRKVLVDRTHHITFTE